MSVSISNNYSGEIVSDEVSEIISYRPHWIIRKGNIIFLLIILCLLLFTWFIQYPDIVNGSARLVALNPPKLITSKANGRLLKLFVTNEQQIKKEQHLAVIENITDYSEAMKLNDWIEHTISLMQANSYEKLSDNPLPMLANLGELQPSYQLFQTELLQTKQTLTNGYYQQKRNGLQRDIKYIATLKDNATKQKELQDEERKLLQKEFDVYEKLAAEKIIAPLELNQYKNKLLAKDQNLKQAGIQITNSDINTHSKQTEILDLQKTIIDQQQKFYSSLLELKAKIEEWVQRYVLKASEDGKLMFATTLQENELITTDQILFYIEPGKSTYYAEVQAGQKNFGKLKKGQRVMLKVESYPSAEFGHLIGTVNYISGMPSRGDSFLIKVDLPNGLQTNYKKTIFFRNSLTAHAEMITDDRKLFDRLMGQLK